ncbi:sulfotransferase domain-containing protein [Streptomyces sp. 4N509B]|uniref:sulfotransferase domain-containing protein n=1 Tax=Streptomyces sp. 4N509B TaxID=3457413 RepID=UPI003FCF5521
MTLPEPTASRSTAGALDHLALHRHNVENLGEDNVVIAGYPGSGAALVGNILLELGLRYLDPYTEELRASGRTSPVAQRREYRSRLAASHRVDTATDTDGDTDGDRALSPLGGPVFVKTHLYPDAFAGAAIRGLILLVRDPRDAIHSYYRWRLGFSEAGEHGTFMDFLRRPGIHGTPPAEDWATFHQAWRDWAEAARTPLALLRFEDLKTEPAAAVRACLADFGVGLDEAALASAVEASSFEAMRAHEDQVAGDRHRIMRRGRVEEWREWYTAELATEIEQRGLVEVATSFGYRFQPDARATAP